MSKDGKGASYDGRVGWKGCLFPAGVSISDFGVMIYEVLFPICTLTWRVNNYVSRQEKVLAALNKESCEEHPRSKLAQNSNAPRSQEDYITQVSEEMEGRVTKRLSKEFSREENRILGALARLDNFLMNPLLQGRSGSTPEASRNPLSTSQGTNEDDSQNDPHPEAGLFHSQITQNCGPEEDHDSHLQ